MAAVANPLAAPPLRTLPRGGRVSDPDDYPRERTAYALRAPDRIIRQAMALGPGIGAFAERLLEGPLPWAKLRQGQKLLRLAEQLMAPVQGTPKRLLA